MCHSLALRAHFRSVCRFRSTKVWNLGFQYLFSCISKRSCSRGWRQRSTPPATEEVDRSFPEPRHQCPRSHQDKSRIHTRSKETVLMLIFVKSTVRISLMPLTVISLIKFEWLLLPVIESVITTNLLFVPELKFKIF